MEYVTLNNGVKIPQIALGVFMIPEDEDEIGRASCRERVSA